MLISQSDFILMNKDLPVESWTETLAYFLGWREIFLIEGNSMLPTLKSGDRVFINRSAKPEVGDIVLARHPFKQNVKIIKRFTELTPENAFFLVGDNCSESTDSRSFGAIPAEDILGVAVCRLKDEK